VHADDLDLPQKAARAVHGVLGLDHRLDGARLRDVMLGARLLDEHEMGGASVAPVSLWALIMLRLPKRAPSFPLYD
jgi:hypothetical protein